MCISVTRSVAAGAGARRRTRGVCVCVCQCVPAHGVVVCQCQCVSVSVAVGVHFTVCGSAPRALTCVFVCQCVPAARAASESLCVSVCVIVSQCVLMCICMWQLARAPHVCVVVYCVVCIIPARSVSPKLKFCIAELSRLLRGYCCP